MYQQTTDLDLRTRIDEAIATGSSAEALALLTQLWQNRPGPTLAGFVLSRFEQLRATMNPTRARVAILRSFTVEPIVPLLRASGAVNGLDLEVHVGDFNTYAQELLNPQSQLYALGPDIVLLAVQTRDIAPELWDEFAELPPEAITASIDRVSTTFRGLVQAYRANSNAHLVIHTLETPPVLAYGSYDSQLPIGQAAAISAINLALADIARAHSGVYILDFDALIARSGRDAWYDERKWQSMRMPIRGEWLAGVAQEWLRFIHPLMGRVCKALVLDLDNTVWGGVIGEDGLDGIKIGKEHPGAAFRALQRAALDLYQRGVILAICSKNNYADAMEVFEKHPEMLLRASHFAAVRINWENKADNLRAIAAELNIGIDSLAFLDDNPTERQLVRSQLPQVTVIEIPEDPTRYAQILRNLPVFERLTLSAEDRERGRYYAEQRQRTELEQHSGSLEEFLTSLQTHVEISIVSPLTLARTAQLTQKTNQFNLTTRRYSEQQIAQMSADPSWRVYTVRASDRFGDHGLIGVAIVRRQGITWHLDTCLLSCRVIGRFVETAMLATVCEHAVADKAQVLAGEFIATKKNAPARDFFPSHRFVCVNETEEKTDWTFDLASDTIAVPTWITCRFVEKE